LKPLLISSDFRWRVGGSSPACGQRGTQAAQILKRGFGKRRLRTATLIAMNTHEYKGLAQRVCKTAGVKRAARRPRPPMDLPTRRLLARAMLLNHTRVLATADGKRATGIEYVF
jgi:hypothetical protein